MTRVFLGLGQQEADAAAINSPLKSRLPEQRKGDWARPKHALHNHGKDKIGAQVMTEVSASIVLRFVVKSPQQSYNDFISIALFHVKHSQLRWTMPMNNNNTHTRISCISKGFISYWLLIDTKILIRQVGE